MTTRSTFLAAGAALTAGALTSAPAAAADQGHAMDQVLARSARHRQVIAAPKLNGGAALRYAGNTLNAFQFALGQGAGSCHVVAVFYGTSLGYVLDDQIWARYKFFDLLDAAGDPLPAMVHTPANPFYRARSTMSATASPSDERGFYHDFTVEALTKRGVSWFACDNALHSLSGQIAQTQGADASHVYGDFVAHLVPGTTIVPAGVAAIVVAQELRYALLPA
jgi:intracellular sulfur oxidation DsrE/DsrF family protein